MVFLSRSMDYKRSVYNTKCITTCKHSIQTMWQYIFDICLILHGCLSFLYDVIEFYNSLWIR